MQPSEIIPAVRWQNGTVKKRRYIRPHSYRNCEIVIRSAFILALNRHRKAIRGIVSEMATVGSSDDAFKR